MISPGINRATFARYCHNPPKYLIMCYKKMTETKRQKKKNQLICLMSEPTFLVRYLDALAHLEPSYHRIHMQYDKSCCLGTECESIKAIMPGT